jgi:hypothetical protein
MRARLTRRWSKDASKGARLVCFGHRFPLLLPIVRKERFLDLVHTEDGRKSVSARYLLSNLLISYT